MDEVVCAALKAFVPEQDRETAVQEAHSALWFGRGDVGIAPGSLESADAVEAQHALSMHAQAGNPLAISALKRASGDVALAAAGNTVASSSAGTSGAAGAAVAVLPQSGRKAEQAAAAAAAAAAVEKAALANASKATEAALLNPKAVLGIGVVNTTTGTALASFVGDSIEPLTLPPSLGGASLQPFTVLFHVQMQKLADEGLQVEPLLFAPPALESLEPLREVVPHPSWFAPELEKRGLG